MKNVDLKTAFLQGEAYEDSRNIVCQLPPEAGHPWYMVALMKKPAYGLVEAPRKWFNVVDKHLRSYGCTPTRADRCTYVLYSDVEKNSHKSKSKTSNPSSSLSELDRLLDPVTGNNAGVRKPCGIICLHVDDLFMAGNSEFAKRVLTKLRRDFTIGSEDKNDITFVGQHIHWKNKGSHNSFIKVDQKLKIDEMQEIAFDKTLRDEILCTPVLHTEFRSVLGNLNWLQSRTQFNVCYKFSRCASRQAAPTIGDCRALNKVVRSVKADPVTLNFWPLKGPVRILGYPDASYKNNEDKSSQRALVIFMAEARTTKGGNIGNSRGSLVEYESHKITATTMSTTVAELYRLMKCFGTCLFLKGLWADLIGQDVEIHIRNFVQDN